MPRRLLLSLLVLVSLGGCGCPNRGSGVAPFTVVAASPTSLTVPLSARFALRFSEDVDRATVSTDAVVLVPTARVNDSFISDLNNPPLSADRRAVLVPITLVTNGSTLNIGPTGILPASTALSLLVSKGVKSTSGQGLTDSRGQPGVYRLDYVTEPPAPTIVDTSLPSGPTPVVPPNLRSINLIADKPVVGAQASAVRLVSRMDGGVEDAVVESVQVLEDGVTIRVRFADGVCTPLCPSSRYELQAGPPLRALEGPELAPFSIGVETAAEPDTQAPAMADWPFIQVSEQQAAVMVKVREPAEGKVLLGPPGGPFTQPFPMQSMGPCSHISARQECPLAVNITGLDLGPQSSGQAYGALLEFWDAFGNTSRFGEFTLTTVRLPRIVITEVYANPPGSEEELSEFIEIINTSTTESYDLSRLSLATHALDDTITRVSTMNLGPYFGGASTMLAPGKRAIVGGAQFDPATVNAPQDVLVMIDAEVRTTFLGGLSATRTSRKYIALYNGDQDDVQAPLIALYRAPEELYNDSSSFPEGRSAERLNLADNDFLVPWCHSVGPPTPGLPNSVDGQAACPRE